MKFIQIICMMMLGLSLNVVPVIAAVKSGEPAPDFTLTNTTGNKVSLSDFAGKYVVLEWFNPECPFVRKHYDGKNMQALQTEYTAKGVIWLSINSSAEGQQGNYAPEKLYEIMKEKGAESSHVLLDEDGAVGHLYEAKTTPHMYIVDPSGKLIYQGAIDDTPSPHSDDIATSKNYVRLVLDAVLDNKEIPISATISYGCTVKYK